MATDYELAKALFGAKDSSTPATSVYYGTAAADSADGRVSVVLDGATAGDSAEVELETSPAVKAGDSVAVTVTDGTPRVTSATGSGDRVLSEMRDTASGLSTRIAQNAESITQAITTAEGTATLVREYSGGVLVCKTGNTVGALVNADGSFQVVEVTWSDGTPTVGDALTNMDSDSADIGANSRTSEVTLCGGVGTISAAKNGTDQITLSADKGVYMTTNPYTDYGAGFVNLGTVEEDSMYTVTAGKIFLQSDNPIQLTPALAVNYGGTGAKTASAAADAIGCKLLYSAKTAESGASTVTLSESAANFKAVIVECGGSFGSATSVVVANGHTGWAWWMDVGSTTWVNTHPVHVDGTKVNMPPGMSAPIKAWVQGNWQSSTGGSIYRVWGLR